MTRSKSLIKNTAVFAIGNLCSYVIMAIMVSLYTYVLSTQEYGSVDIVIQLVSLTIPIFTLGISDAVFRFSMDKNYEVESVLTSSLVVLCFGLFLSFITMPLILGKTDISKYTIYFLIILFIQSVSVLVKQFTKSIEKVRLYAVGGIINSFCQLVFNLIFLYVFKLNIQGYFLAIFFAYLIELLFLIINIKIWKYMSIKKININLVKHMTLFSLPLIPNTIMWWIVGVSDRFIIASWLGISATGLYAVASKIPSILNSGLKVFFQAWQISAIKELNSNDKDEYQSKVFNFLACVLFLTVSIIVVFCKIILKVWVAPEFFGAWMVIPILLISIIFDSLQAFLGTNYIANKNTMGAFLSSLTGALINIIINIFLIPHIGIAAAAISTAISYIAIFLIRYYGTKRYVKINIDVKKFSLSLSIILGQIILIYSSDSTINLIAFVGCIIMILVYKKEIFSILKLALKNK
ncbi:oligosaccharide flippase family protein [Clostridium subterminale]|uniref:Oligosaccharide flippase family protein n=1 Tax=Clostridium subterminale TaxID=1550 RepID=A0ABN1KJ58_CLOSU